MYTCMSIHSSIYICVFPTYSRSVAFDFILNIVIPNMRTYEYIYICISIYIYIYMYLSKYVYIYTYVFQTYSQGAGFNFILNTVIQNMHMNEYMYISIFVYIYIHICTYLYIHIYMSSKLTREVWVLISFSRESFKERVSATNRSFSLSSSIFIHTLFLCRSL